MSQKLHARGDYEHYCSNTGLLVARWKNTMEVIVSNFHKPTVDGIEWKQKDAKSIKITCPEAIVFYNKYMGGVDLSDQLFGLYEIDKVYQVVEKGLL